MIYLIESPSTDPHFNLALEQYVFDSLDRRHSYIMLWLNDNAIIVGKFQNTARELDAAFVRAQGIRVVRRLSGGGAVYHDLGNLNFTFIVDAPERTAFDFSVFCQPVIKLLRSLGVDARMSGRNDMTAAGKKFSGNAQYQKDGRLMHHGTLLFDSDLSVLGRALTPPPDKMESKGTASVSSQVTNLRPLLDRPMEMADFQAALREHLIAENGEEIEPFPLREQDLAGARALQREVYDSWEWNWGRSPGYRVEKARRVEGCGRVEVQMEVDGGRIRALAFTGDFFGGDVEALAERLRGASLEPEALRELLGGIDLGQYLHNLTREDLISILTE